MKLEELVKYNPITIQCHDNPDADAIAAGYALCRYFEYSMGFSLLRALEFFAFRKMEMPETKTHLLCGWRRFVIQKITFPLQ